MTQRLVGHVVEAAVEGNEATRGRAVPSELDDLLPIKTQKRSAFDCAVL